MELRYLARGKGALIYVTDSPPKGVDVRPVDEARDDEPNKDTCLSYDQSNEAEALAANTLLWRRFEAGFALV